MQVRVGQFVVWRVDFTAGWTATSSDFQKSISLITKGAPVEMLSYVIQIVVAKLFSLHTAVKVFK